MALNRPTMRLPVITSKQCRRLLDVEDVVDNPELSHDWEGRLSSAAYRLFDSDEL